MRTTVLYSTDYTASALFIRNNATADYIDWKTYVRVFHPHSWLVLVVMFFFACLIFWIGRNYEDSAFFENNNSSFVLMSCFFSQGKF